MFDRFENGASRAMSDRSAGQPSQDGRTDYSSANRFGAWTRSLRPWQTVLLIFFGVMPFAAIMLAMWIGLAFALNRDPAHPVSAEAALNLLLVVFVAVPGFFFMHRAQYRWFWHLDRARATGRLKPSDRDPDYGSEPSEPAPKIAWSPVLRLRHALMYLLGMAILIMTFAPYEHQISIIHWLDRFSAGSASRGSLSGIVFVYLPMILFCTLAMLLTYRQMKRRDAGALDAAEALELGAEVNWLFSFAAAFAIASLLCRFAGSAILGYMR